MQLAHDEFILADSVLVNGDASGKQLLTALQSSVGGVELS